MVMLISIRVEDGVVKGVPTRKGVCGVDREMMCGVWWCRRRRRGEEKKKKKKKCVIKRK